jgi:nucleotide-binding universal stress UspA family protein
LVRKKTAAAEYSGFRSEPPRLSPANVPAENGTAVALTVSAMALPVLIAAVDLGPQTPRVLHHAAGFARLLALKLKILHVAADASEKKRDDVLGACLRQGPYEVDFSPDDIVVRTGAVSEAIAREARREQATLVVMGARGQGRVASFLLGSTSEAVLRAASVPVLLVPPNDMDIVTISDAVALTCGPVIAAVDLAEHCDEQLRLASQLAFLGHQRLILMTVAKSRTTDHDAGADLRRRSHHLEPRRPAALIVRRGSVAEEIARCASTEGAGLVVMGLGASPKTRPGAIAVAVLKTRKAFVLAVPGC